MIVESGGGGVLFFFSFPFPLVSLRYVWYLQGKRRDTVLEYCRDYIWFEGNGRGSSRQQATKEQP